jgi:guanylate kinase
MEKTIGNLTKGLLFIISSPSGAGKSTLVNQLINEFPQKITRSVTSTTRKPRAGEQDGVDYHFLSKKEFLEYKQSGLFLESAEVFGNHYGTLKSSIEQSLEKGMHVILVIDTQGAKQVREMQREAVFIFISPPGREELKRRLTERATETKESLQIRLGRADEEMEDIRFFDYHIINDDLLTAYKVLKSIFIAEEHKIYNEER